MVAKLAFDHLTGSLNTSSSSPVRPTCSVQQPKTNETLLGASFSWVNSTNMDDKKLKDMAHLYKNQLQIYAQKRNLVLPMYVSEREGPPHACRFKSKVTLEGKTYESLEYFSTIKDAENAAAKVALMALSSDGIEEEDPSFFKNLLQELAQKEFSCLPEYNTTCSGPSHMPKFISTVEIKDKSFRGQEAKTKKLAEMNAAKVAYTALKERQWKQNPEPYSPGSHAKDTPHCSSPKVQSTAVAELSRRIIPNPGLGSSEASTEEAKCNKGANQKMTQSKHVMVEPEVSTFAEHSSRGHKPPISLTAPVQCPSRSSLGVNTEPSIGTHAWSSSYKQVKVYPVTPNMAFPPGTTVMHSDEKWVAVTNMDSVHRNA